MNTSRHHWKRLSDLLAALLCGGVLAAVVPGYPLGPHWLLAFLLIYGAVLWHWPRAWLLMVPAALPVLDLAPWTGRFFIDEFDALLAVTLLMGRWRLSRGLPAAQVSRPARAWLVLFCLSTCISLLIGLWPFAPPGLNGLNHYYSLYNGLRLSKGLLWALLLWPLLRAALAVDVAKTQRRFALGMGLGVFACTLAVAWERAAFPGLFNFESGYRVVGLFSGMHTGGACIEAYYALALPFLAWWTLSSRRWRERLFGALLLAAGSYGLLVTYARAGYLAAALGLLVLAFGMRRRWMARPGKSVRSARGNVLRTTMLFALLAILGAAVSEGEAMQRRYASIEHDFGARIAHWADAIRMMDGVPGAGLIGMGIGRYPRTYFMKSGEGVGPYLQALREEDGNAFLTMAPGAPLYLEQMIGLRPDQPYRLTFLARGNHADTRLIVAACEKWMLYSARCLRQVMPIGDTGGIWQRYSIRFNSRSLGTLPRYAPRTVKLTLFSIANGSLVDIDDLALTDGGQHQFLRNGSFSKGMDNWFFTGDNHLPYHLENTWLQVVFEQGLIGLAAFGGLIVCAVLALGRRLRAGDAYAPVLAAALAAFLPLSLLDSLFDFPRISLIFYLVIIQALSDSKKTMTAAPAP